MDDDHGVLQRLKKNHRNLHIGLIITTALLTMSLALFFENSIHVPDNKKPGLNWNAMGKDIPSFYSIRLSSTGVLELFTFDLNMSEIQMSMTLYGPSGHMTGFGPKIKTYHFNELLVPPTSISNIPSKKFYVLFDMNAMKLLYSNMCTIIIETHCDNDTMRGVEWEIETIPWNIVRDMGIIIYHKNDEYSIYGFISPLDPSDSQTNVGYKYNVVRIYPVHPTTTANVIWENEYVQGNTTQEREINYNIPNGLLNINMTYTVNLIFRTYTTDFNGDDIHLGHIVGIPFNPARIAQFNP